MADELTELLNRQRKERAEEFQDMLRDHITNLQLSKETALEILTQYEIDITKLQEELNTMTARFTLLNNLCREHGYLIGSPADLVTMFEQSKTG